ncbi:hypothetical protein BaRGS_00005049 [Batillaria attramentaria]|uniref:non-specific serine/threonine protein kinase n=1 Tax=Batillaria attramentaria TaxID=370345 RepID=A0ABD0LV24_9CAEN
MTAVKYQRQGSCLVCYKTLKDQSGFFLYRHIVKVYRPLLLWKTGLLIRQGPVDILVDLWYNDSKENLGSLPSSPLCGTPVLVIAARLPMLLSPTPNPITRIQSNKCLWAALQSVTSPCEGCCENNLKTALQREACFHFAYYLTLSAELRGSKCRLHKDIKISIPEKCGPRKCCKWFCKYEKAIRPGFMRSGSFQTKRDHTDPNAHAGGKVVYRGCLLNIKKDQAVIVKQPMSPVYFDCFYISIFRGYDYILNMMLANDQTLRYEGLTGVFIDQHGKKTENIEFVCREGYLLEVRMNFSKTPGKSDVLIFLNGLHLLTQEVDCWEMNISVSRRVGGACLIRAPGIKNMWQRGERVAPLMGNTVEVLEKGEESESVTAAIFSLPQSQDKEQQALPVIETVTGWKMGTFNKRIRPRGYAELKGLEMIGSASEMKAPGSAPKVPLPLWKFSQRKKDEVERAMFRNGHVDYTECAVMLLPKYLSVSDLTIVPTYLCTHELEAHPLCYMRGDINSVMTVMPTYNLPAQVECFALVHTVDNPGFTFPMDVVEQRPLLWAWAIMLLRLQKDGLTTYSHLLKDIEGIEKLSPDKVWRGLQQVIRQLSYLLYLGMEGQFSQYYFHEYDTVRPAVEGLRRHVLSHIEPDPAAFGLTKVDMVFNTDTSLHVCPGHAATWQAGMAITEIPQPVLDSYPQFIYSLLLANNDISSIPGSVFTALRNLKDLDLSMNKLESLPDEISHCTKMTSISLISNRLSSLPDSLARCQEMNRIEISKNHFTKFPQVLTKLVKLRRLYAQNLQLTKLPDDIGNLQELRKLYLNGNCFTSLPPSLAKLQCLQDLSLNGVAWCKVRPNQLLSKQHFEEMLDNQNLARWLEQNNQNKSALFQQFDEDTNGTLDPREIGKLNATIFTIFPRFGYMGCEPPDDDTPSGFPEEILALENLEYLGLQYQGLVKIPEGIQRLKKLSVLNISSNPNLLSVAAQAGSLPLKRLEMDECPMLKTPPKEIRAKGFLSTFAFLRRLLSGSVDCKRTKLMLVGLGGAGKTSLVKSLMSSTGKADMTVGEEITDGIDICPWTVDTEEGPITYSVWDFAGQTVYYNTHQFFLSDRAVYLLLWNIRLGHEHAGLDFWLSSISVHAPKAPIFVVGTHVDQVSKVELPMREMRERYSQIVDFFFVSSFSGQGIQDLREQMIDVTLQQQYMGEKIPGVWLSFEEALKRITGRSVIPYSELERIANTSGIFETSEVIQAVQFLHELGSLQHFTNDFLKDQVVINPQWIVDVMACVVSVKDSAIKDGRLRHEDIGLVWKEYPESLHSWLLRLTEEYDLTFPLKDEKVNLVPCLLTEKEPEFEWPELEKGSGLRETKMVYKFDYLPAGLFNRGQVRLHEFSDRALVWKRGSYLRKNGHICLVRQTRGSELVVHAQGPRPENILFLVHEVFEGLILESFQGVTYDYLVPCPECLRLLLKGPHMFAASTVRRAAELKAPFLQCLKYFHTISIVDLQTSMPPEGSADFDLHLVQAVQGLKELQRDLAADIFVSFCKKDENAPIAPAKVLSDVEKLGYKSWMASSASGQSMDEMAKALMDAPLFVAFMSNSFVEDESCCNLFKYARLTLHKPILLITVGSGFEWRQSKLGILLADEVYVNMQQPERYAAKLEDLKTALMDRIRHGSGDAARDIPPCFISYCWQNSARAVAKGSRTVEGAVGYGDPRDIKDYLETKGIKCWIDVERVGLHGLFEDIGEGLVNAKVVLVCVSDQYAASNNCVVEFRFVANTLKLPVVLAVVGSGCKWRATEVGALSQSFPMVSFQEQQNEAVLDRLVRLIQPYLSADSGVKDKDSVKATSKDQKSHSFQELCELAQRKFLRQLVVYAEVQDMLPYPRLFLVDFVKSEQDAGNALAKDAGKKEGEAGDGKKKQLSSETNFHQQRFCVSLLCEHAEGWHVSGDPIRLPEEFGASLEEYAPFIARITAIARYSKKLVMNCMAEETGKIFLQWLEKNPQIAEVSDFQPSYHKLRQTVAEVDENRTMGNLARCHLPNGQMAWLCEKHRQNVRVTVLGDTDTATGTHHATESIGVDHFIQALREMNTAEMSRHDARSESRTAFTPLPPTAEEPEMSKTTPATGATEASTSSNVTDTSGVPPSSGISKRASKSKMKPVGQPENPKGSLQRQPSQLTFSGVKSKACVLM